MHLEQGPVPGMTPFFDVSRQTLTDDCLWPILLKKSVIQNCLMIDRRKRLFFTLLREICVWKPQPKVKISISHAYFSAAETMADFFNRIGRLPSFASGKKRPEADGGDRQKSAKRGAK
jgi:hypothetical protein